MRLIDADKMNPRSICPTREDDSAYDTLCDFIAEQPTVPQWISIFDKEPPLFEIVLVSDGEMVSTASYQGDDNWSIDYELDDEVFYWMPLPEPPDEVNDEN